MHECVNCVNPNRPAQYNIHQLSKCDDQSILIETSSCNLQFFSELITTQLRDFHMVSPQVSLLYLK